MALYFIGAKMVVVGGSINNEIELSYRLDGEEVKKMNFRSYSEEVIRQTLEKGEEQVWELDTGNDGYDDHLIGTYDEALDDILYHQELKKLPEYWTLTLVDWEI